MKKSLVVILMILAMAAFAAAQIGPPTSDVLGAHLNYGRGCAACHAPHNGASGNGANKSGNLTGGTSILWGQDVGALFGKTIITGSTNGSTGYTEVLPATMAAGTPDVNGLLTCLSCHDGNYATGAMMKDAVYETLPATYGTWNAIPTLLGGGLECHRFLRRPVELGLRRDQRHDRDDRPEFLAVRKELWLLRVPNRLQQHGCGYLHELPQPALDERCQRYQRPEEWFADWVLQDDVLRNRPLQPG